MTQAAAGRMPPVLLFNDECAVCRAIARWVHASAQDTLGGARIVDRPIGSDPDALHALHADLDIWDAYATIHVLMPDGSMKLGGEAVAEVLRDLPNTQWFAGLFAVRAFGTRPFQRALDLAYTVLSDVRPLFGCESSGSTNVWVRSAGHTITWLRALAGSPDHHSPAPNAARSR